MAVKVTLLTHTPDPEQVVAMAAKLCYSPSGIEDIREGLTEEKTAAFIDMLAGLGHASPTEHASFTFGIEGISRACSHQLVRHRIASYSQQSQRYVDGTKFDFVTPPAIRENPKALEAYNRVLAEQAQAYSAIRDALAAGYIAEYLGEPQEGTDAEIIERFKTSHKTECAAFIKKANEDARFILPNASTTKIVCTFKANAAAMPRGGAALVPKLRTVLFVRSLSRGQNELRQAKRNERKIRRAQGVTGQAVKQ